MPYPDYDYAALGAAVRALMKRYNIGDLDLKYDYDLSNDAVARLKKGAT